MTRWSLRLRLGMAAALATIAAAFVGSSTLKAEPDKPADSESREEVVVGVKHCTYCHETPPRNPDDLPEDKQGIARFDEVTCWRDQDWHSRATAALESELGRRISSRLYGDPNAAQSKTECLTCHGAAPERKQNAYDAAEGVTCTVCHGASEEWLRHHWLDQDWRSKRKQAEFGMIDMSNPIQRAQQCATCHVGSVSEQKVVTHPMYAAGHPPLPPFEAVSYAKQMPPHWDVAKVRSLRDEKTLQNPSTSNSREALLGVVATFRSTMELLSHSAQAGQHWPRFEQFDCYACHHDLRVTSWRQQRMSGPKEFDPKWQPPGRPRPREWEMSFLGAVVEAVDPEQMAAFTKHRDHLYTVFQAQPFGSPEQIAAAAGELAKWSTEWLAELSQMPMDTATRARILQALCQAGQNLTLDRDAARQLSWLISVFAEEAMPEDNAVLAQLTELSNLWRLDFRQERNDLPFLAEGRVAEDYRDREAFEHSGEPAEFARLLKAIAQAAEAKPPQ